MKKILIPFLFILFSSKMWGQTKDFIVLKNGDTIQCIISKIDDKFIYYYKPGPDIKKVKKVPLEASQKYFSEDKEKLQIQFNEMSKVVRFGFSTGYSKTVAPIGGLLGNYFTNNYEVLRSGIYYSGILSYQWSKYIGVGVDYSYYNRSSNDYAVVVNQVRDTLFVDNVIDISSEIHIHNVGPHFSLAIPLSSNERVAWVNRVGVGYQYYQNDFQLFDAKNASTTKGTESGRGYYFLLSSGIDIMLSKYLAFNVETNYLHGDITKTEYSIEQPSRNDFENNRPLNLSRFNIGIGIRFYFY